MVETTELEGKGNIRMVFTRENVTAGLFQAWWRFQPSDKATTLGVLEGRRTMTGFAISWRVLNGSVDTDTHEAGYLRSNRFLIRMVNFVAKSRSTMTVAEMWSEITIFKLDLVLRRKFGQCSGDQIDLSYIYIFNHLFRDIDIDDTPSANVTEEDLNTGFELFSFLAHCPQYLFYNDHHSVQLAAMKLYVFFIDLLSTKSPRTIIQTTMNFLKSATDPPLYTLASEIFGKLDSIFHFQLGNIAVALSSPSASYADAPFLNNSAEEMDKCNTSVECDIITGLRKSGN
jgi:hypothetical protein